MSKRAAFVAIWSRTHPYASYSGDSSREEPMVILVHRWDGCIGFPGGFVDDGETPLAGGVRELFEECGIVLWDHEVSSLECLVEHSVSGEVFSTVFALEVDEQRFRNMLSAAGIAPHALSEGWSFPARCRDSERASFSNLLASPLMPGVREELLLLVERMSGYPA